MGSGYLGTCDGTQQGRLIPDIRTRADARQILPRDNPRHERRSTLGRGNRATLYEAVAHGIAAIRGNEWVSGIAQGMNVVKVSMASVRVNLCRISSL